MSFISRFFNVLINTKIMTKEYTIETNHDMKTNSCNLFDIKQDEVNSTYIDALNLFKKVFELIDFNSIFKK